VCEDCGATIHFLVEDPKRMSDVKMWGAEPYGRACKRKLIAELEADLKAGKGG
jgi:hypothetical protein